MGITINPAWVSEKRFAGYLEAAEGDAARASELYKWNARVSSALFELIHHVEVLLRNAIVVTLERNGSAPELPPGSPWIQNVKPIEEIIGRLKRIKKEPTAALVYANLTFGYWQRMFGAEHDEMWRHALQFAFPHGKVDRKMVASYLESINALRNRIAHHGSLIDFDTAVEARKIISFASWIDRDAAQWLRTIEQVSAVSGQRPIEPRRNVVVVAAEHAWPLYHDNGQSVYVFQAARSMKKVDYVAFYADQEVKPSIPKILARFVAVDWNKPNAKRLRNSDDPHEKIIGRAIVASMARGWNESSYQVFVLSSERDAETVILPSAVNHSRRGAGSAFVRAHRYLPLSVLMSARDTADLQQ